jgi:SAM-dependent methyltransferase
VTAAPDTWRYRQCVAPAFGEVSRDGSPVAVYLALAAREVPGLIQEAVAAGGSILELGCGAGRLTRPLIALGHPVVAVDDSEAMLEHVTGAEKVCADLFTLDLGRRFDAVVAAGHLIHVPDRGRRQALLRVCRQHVKRPLAGVGDGDGAVGDRVLTDGFLVRRSPGPRGSRCASWSSLAASPACA